MKRKNNQDADLHPKKTRTIDADIPMGSFSYSQYSCEQMDKQMKCFEAILKKNEAGNVFLANHIYPQQLILDSKASITFSDCFKYFGNSGHAFAFDLSKNSHAPLMFDIDCKKCKAKEHHESFDDFYYEKLLRELARCISNLKLPTDYIAMRRSNSCGIHIYFNCNVSIVLYNILLSFVMKECELPMSLFFDRISMLPLPYSSKSDHQQYIIFKSTIDDFALISEIWYDVDYTKALEINPSQQLIGIFVKLRNIDIPGWENLYTKNIFLQTNVKITKTSKNQLPGLHMHGYAFQSENFPILESHFNDTTMEDVIIPKFDPDPCLIRLAKVVANLHYGINVEDSQIIKYLIFFIKEHEYKYSFYLLICIFYYISNLQSIEIAKQQLEQLCSNDEKLLNILNLWFEIDDDFELHRIFNTRMDEPILWIKMISQQILAQKIDQILIEEAPQYFRNKFNFKLSSKNSEDIYYYHDGQYIKSSIVAFQKSPLWYNNLKKIQIFNGEKIGTFSSSILMESIDCAEVMDRQMNSYNYFINIGDGVWNSITHSIMAKVPFLYFNTEMVLYPTNINVDFSIFERSYEIWVRNILCQGLYDLSNFLDEKEVSQVFDHCKYKILKAGGKYDPLFLELARNFELDEEQIPIIAKTIQTFPQAKFFELETIKSPAMENSFDLPQKHLSIVYHCLKKLYNNYIPSVMHEMIPLNFLEYTFLNVCDFDEITIMDMLKSFATIFNINNPRKRLILLIGAGETGKSTFIKLFNEIFKKSSFNTNKLFIAPNNGPNPEIKAICSNYIVVINEIEQIDPGLLKIVTGDDSINKRNLYEKEFTQLKSCCAIFATANSPPIIKGIDEAVFIRLAPFKFSKKFYSENQCNRVLLTTNPLYTCSRNIICGREFSIAKEAQNFTNLLYSVFKKFRGTNSRLEINLQNKNSFSILEVLMSKNNEIYKILESNKIVRGEALSMPFQEFAEVLNNGEKKFNVGELRIRFAAQITHDTIYGFGYKNRQNVPKHNIEYFKLYPMSELKKNFSMTALKMITKNCLRRKNYIIPIPDCFAKPIAMPESQ